MYRKLSLALGLGMIVGGSGCLTHRLVERTPQGGTYAVYGDPVDALAEARPEMEQHCGGPVQIVREGEVPIGEVIHTEAAEHKRRSGVTLASSTTQTAQKTEWRVTYVCGSSASSTPAAD